MAPSTAMRENAAATPNFRRLEAATAALDPPFAVVDLDAFQRNAQDLARRSAGKPIRLATKSVRCRALIETALRSGGFRGVLAYSLAEALWLAEHVEDVVVGYPTTDRHALQRLASDEGLVRRVTLMVDTPDHLAFVDAAVGPTHRPLRVCLDLDASLRALGGRLHIGARRSPVHDVDSAVELAHAVARHSGFHLVGILAYEAQIAGVADDPVGRPFRGMAIRAMKRLSRREIKARRGAIVDAVRKVAPLEFVNGGGTGSLETTSGETAVSETCAGSGLLGPGVFDSYRGFRPEPAALFALSVVRRPASGVVTVEGGGWIASGPPGRDRLPVVAYPPGLAYFTDEGAGEVQTPLRGDSARGLAIGDRVWFRHAKAGELCERVNTLHLVSGDRIIEAVPTYRGEGRAFL